LTLQIHEDQEKLKLLGVTELSEVERRYSITALKIFKERYLLKDNDGNTVERLDDLFKRVAVSAGLMEILYDPQIYNKSRIENRTFHIGFEINENIDYKDLNTHRHNITIGQFIVNQYHIERLFARYDELASEGHMKLSPNYFFQKLSNDTEFKERYLSLIQKFYDLMANAVFLPNTPTLMNAGTKLGQNAACFTLDMEDSIEGITKTWTDVTKIFKSGGGIGINYSKIRPEGSFVSTTGGQASGPISYLKIVDAITGTIAQGGKRRGAAMGILNVIHDDIEKFIDLKDNKTLENHNISVCMPDIFFSNFLIGEEYTTKIMNKITQNAWKTGDPGMVFVHNMNKNNLLEPVFKLPIQVTNPCSEISMYPYESCILASINLNKFLSPIDNKFDLEEFINTTRTVTHFLDNIIDATKYPIDEINKMTKDCRRIGVGFMGLADVLARLEIPYNSESGFIFTEYISAVMTMTSLLESNRLSEYKGPFPLFNHPDFQKDDTQLPLKAFDDGSFEDLNKEIPKIEKYFSYRYTEDLQLSEILTNAYEIIAENYPNGLRNCSTTTIAPTGTLSMFADCSSGIEPLFSLEYTKKVTLGEFKYLDKNYERALKSGMDEETLKKVFVTAMDIHPFDHIMMQAGAQCWITNGISKTINAPNDITPKEIEYCYVLSWALGNKGITVYRDKCKDVQVLNNNSIISKNNKQEISEYTREYIEDLDLPDEYKNRLLMNTITRNEHQQPFIYSHPPLQVTFGSNNTMVIPSVCSTGTITFVGNCMNCGSQNSHERNGSPTCFLCKSCGASIGSCS
jgi:ribonucleoside-diphosphate reductase alpha chain